MNNLNSLQSALADLKEVVQRTPGTNSEALMVVRQLEQIVADIERKTRKQQAITVVVSPTVQVVPVV